MPIIGRQAGVDGTIEITEEMLKAGADELMGFKHLL